MKNHPLSDFLYCPHCGSSHFAEHDAFSKKCSECGFTFYPNAAAATVAIIVNAKDEILCVRRNREPAKGTLDLPGGFVDPGESITEGLVREVKEELGADILHYEFAFSYANTYMFSNHEVHTADAFFLCTLKDYHSVRASDDASEAMWTPLASIRPEDFGLDSIRQGVKHFLLSTRQRGITCAVEK